MQRGHSKSDTVRTARVFSLPGFCSPDTENEKMFPKEVFVENSNREDWWSNVCTSAAPILLPHHYLLILFSSRQEGDSLAEAEAAFTSRVLPRIGALTVVQQ